MQNLKTFYKQFLLVVFISILPIKNALSATVSSLGAGQQLAWIEESKEAIKQKLRDPDSATWRNVKFYSGSGHPIVCGEVNSKNGFGGMGGYQRFIAAGNVLAVIESEMTNSAEMNTSWKEFCK